MILRPFFNYYLPTLEKILVKYKEIESSGVPTEEITKSTITCLEDIKIPNIPISSPSKPNATINNL